VLAPVSRTRGLVDPRRRSRSFIEDKGITGSVASDLSTLALLIASDFRSAPGQSCIPVARGDEAYHWTMSGLYSACPESDPSDRLAAADVLVRQEPDEKDEEEDEGDRQRT
jgi:hypothetical protein